MNQKELLADLRNKLSPIKNYLEMQRGYESLSNADGVGAMTAYSNGMKMAELKGLIQKEKIQAEKSMHQVEVIIEMLENS